MTPFIVRVHRDTNNCSLFRHDREMSNEENMSSFSVCGFVLSDTTGAVVFLTNQIRAKSNVKVHQLGLMTVQFMRQVCAF